jgi:hypothetical protein
MDYSSTDSLSYGTATPARSRTDRGEKIRDPDDRALAAITDFMNGYQVTVQPDLPINDALIAMICAGARALIVTQQAGETPGPLVLGMITAQAIEAVLRKRDQHLDVLVRDVMTPCTELPLINYASLQLLTVHDLHDRFRGTGLTHILIVESDEHDFQFARGLISRAAVARRLQSIQGVAA